jgi:2-polyprenyl-3-methyl-5-hydroxy-6-metoxy-1,4-benzoquinol methylase
MGKAYEKYFTHEIENKVAPATLLNHIKQVSKNGYLNKKWETSIFPASQTLGMLLLPSFKTFLDGQMMRHLPRPANGRMLLDVGCGSGQFLALAQSAGWRVTGLDPDPKAVETARSKGLDVQLGGIENLAQISDCFDAITVSHVIEHAYNPHELLSSCYRLLKQSGYFWIETPNIDSFGHFEFKANWRGLEPPRHLQLLSWPFLQRMLNEIGFNQVTKARWRLGYLGINSASKAIMKCDGEPVEVQPTFFDRIKSQFVELRNRIDYTKREFVTLRATK